MTHTKSSTLAFVSLQTYFPDFQATAPSPPPPLLPTLYAYDLYIQGFTRTNLFKILEGLTRDMSSRSTQTTNSVQHICHRACLLFNLLPQLLTSCFCRCVYVQISKGPARHASCQFTEVKFKTQSYTASCYKLCDVPACIYL